MNGSSFGPLRSREKFERGSPWRPETPKHFQEKKAWLMEDIERKNKGKRGDIVLLTLIEVGECNLKELKAQERTM